MFKCKFSCTETVYAGNQQGLVADTYDFVHVHDHLNAEAGNLGQPLPHAAVILMIAGYGVDAKAGVELAERPYMRAQAFDAAVDQIAGQGDDIRAQAIGGIDDSLDVARFYGWAHMQIGNLDDGKPAQRLWQTVDRKSTRLNSSH